MSAATSGNTVAAVDRSLVGRVQEAIRDGDYEVLPTLVSSRPEILWEPALCTGWSALHFAASHFLPLVWWKYLLFQAPNPTGLIEIETALGETVFDISGEVT